MDERIPHACVHMGDAFIFQDNTRILRAFYCAAVVGIHRM